MSYFLDVFDDESVTIWGTTPRRGRQLSSVKGGERCVSASERVSVVPSVRCHCGKDGAAGQNLILFHLSVSDRAVSRRCGSEDGGEPCEECFGG